MFCARCGERKQPESENAEIGNAKLMTLEEYRSVKSVGRTSHFQPKKMKAEKKDSSSSSSSNSIVE